MGALMKRNRGGLTTVGKIGVGLAVLYVASHVLPAILATGLVMGIIGTALVATIASVFAGLAGLLFNIGLPIFVIVLLISLFTSDD